MTKKLKVSFIRSISGIKSVVVNYDGKTEIKPINKTQIAEIFQEYGGSFVKKLGEALMKADIVNSSKILNTWDELVEEYIKRFIVVEITQKIDLENNNK